MNEKKPNKRALLVPSRSTGVSNSNTVFDVRTSLPSIKSKGKFNSDPLNSGDASVEGTYNGNSSLLRSRRAGHSNSKFNKARSKTDSEAIQH